MSDKPTPLALPWPAWHTDQYLAIRHLRELSDRDLKRADYEHTHFCEIHSSWYSRAKHIISHEEDERAAAVKQVIDREEADHFRKILHQRDLAAIRASFSRKRNREKLPKAA